MSPLVHPTLTLAQALGPQIWNPFENSLGDLDGFESKIKNFNLTDEERSALLNKVKALRSKIVNVIKEKDSPFTYAINEMFDQCLRDQSQFTSDVNKVYETLEMRKGNSNPFRLELYRRRHKDSELCTAKVEMMLQECREEVYAILRISQNTSRAINTITQKEANEFLEREQAEKAKEEAKKREDLAAKLIEEEDVMRAASQKKKTLSKRKKAPKKAIEKEKAPAAATPKPAVVKVHEKSAHLDALYKLSSKVKMLDRVTKRWITKDPVAIRDFQDLDANNNVVYRYKDLSNEEIEVQRAKHYLPGTELLLLDPYNKNVYSFPSDRGHGMFARLNFGDEVQFGIIYFGFNQDGTLYHRYFERRENAGNIQAIFIDPLKDAHSHAGKNKSPVNEEKNDGDWQHQKHFIIELEKTGVMRFTYPGEKHSVQIYPVRKDLLNPALLD